MEITIDSGAGFCWGVVRTIDKVEEVLNNNKDHSVYVLGQIIHNPQEIFRLESEGLKTLTLDDLSKAADENAKVIIRAHGEPPSTYNNANELGLDLIDATCPLVSRLQRRVKEKYDEGWQVVIFGKYEHAEIIGLRGVCNDECIVVDSIEQALESVDFNKKTVLLSQTTMDRPSLQAIKQAMQTKFAELHPDEDIMSVFRLQDTICHFVSGREDNLKEFASSNDVVLFVTGKKSSNGKSLYMVVKGVNPHTYMIEEISEIDNSWFDDAQSIGITGATSTPQWYMEQIKDELTKRLISN